MKIVLIGSGNVATHCGAALQGTGNNIVQVFSRRKENAELLATKLNCRAIQSASELDRNADLYLIMVSDDQIANVADQLGNLDGIVTHTSGSIDRNVLENCSENTGVFWTPQTFSKEREPALKSAPFCIEASNDTTLRTLMDLASEISIDVRAVNGEQRKAIHLAAVIGANFSNHMYTLAAELLKKNGMELEVLGPLLKETLQKALDIGPEAGQTGPARRGDKKVIAEHLESLSDDQQLKEIYDELSSAIVKHFEGNDL